MSRLPGFLRLDSAITARAAVEAQHQLFAHLNRMERQRAQAAFAPSSPFSVLHAVQDSTRELNRCKLFALISCSLICKPPSGNYLTLGHFFRHGYFALSPLTGSGWEQFFDGNIISKLYQC